MNRRVLALDLATKTGWAFWTGRSLHSGMKNLKAKTDGLRLLALYRWLTLTIHGAHGVDVIAVERAAGGKRGAANEVLPALRGIVHLVAAQNGSIPIVETAPTSLKKFAVGNGRASKDEMVLAAKKFWPHQEIKTDDQADALCLLRWALETAE